jgi:uncharacterized protein with PIN domain
MLFKLARWLRLLGLDVAGAPGATDEELIQRSMAERRTLITRDKGLALRCAKLGCDCLLIRSSKLEDQLAEMASLGLKLELHPERCTLCNAPLEEMIVDVRARWRCQGCGKIYWQGSHWPKIRERLENLARLENSPRSHSGESCREQMELEAVNEEVGSRKKGFKAEL